jgi:MutS domain V
MKALLMHQDRDFDFTRELPRHERALTQDLELNTLLGAMAGGDDFLFNVARQAIFSGVSNDLDAISYRQEILKDCLKQPAAVRELHALAVEAIEEKRKQFMSFFSNYPAGTLSSAVDSLRMFMSVLKRLKLIADTRAGQFESRGFTAFFAMLRKEFSDEYFAIIQNHLRELKFRGGVLVSAELGDGNQGSNCVLRQPQRGRPNWLMRLLGKGQPSYTFHLHPRDDAGARIFGEMRDRGINLVANALAQSTDHILSFFQMLRTELGFYVGCLNLREKLASRSVPVTLPQPHAAGERKCRFSGLHDACLALTTEEKVVSNTIDADGKNIVIITGANQGGKSSFLRSIGLAQLMMQSGMFVAAESFAGELCAGLFTHYKREEDATKKSGKLDEELGRMSDIVAAVVPNSIVLFNESFGSTNEREGSEIARQIVAALVERHIKVFFVTHLYEFAHGLFENKREDSIFLRAERRTDGTRTFKLVEGEPLETSFGEDLYAKVFAVGIEASSGNRPISSTSHG